MNNVNLKNALLEVQHNNWVSKVAKYYNVSEERVKNLYETNLNGIEVALTALNEGETAKKIVQGIEQSPAGGVVDSLLNLVTGRKPKVDTETPAAAPATPAADPAALAREKTLDDLAAAAGATRAPKEPAGGDRMVNVKEPVAPPAPPKEPAGGDSMVKRKEALSPEELAAKKEAGARDQDLSRWSRNSVTTDMSKFRQAEVDSMKKLKDMEDAAKVTAKKAEDTQTFRKAEQDSMAKLKDFGKKAAIPAAVVAVGTGAALMNRDRQDASAETPTTPAPEEPATKYKVAAGDTLSDLANKNKVSVADIAKANDLKDIHKINVGQELVIPKATGNQIYKYNVGTESGPKSSKDIKSLLQKQENRDRVNESLLAAFNEIVSSKHPNLFAEAAKKGSVPKNEKEKKLAALAEPKDKITHKDVLVGRGVVKEEEQIDEAAKEAAEHSLGHQTAEAIHQWSNHLQYNNNGSKARGILKAVKKKHGPEVAKDFEQSVVNASENLTGSGEADKSDHVMKHFTPQDHEDFNARMKHRKIDVKNAIVTKSIGEEVGFSEAELAHIASIVEGTPIAPSPKKYVPNGSDKTNATGSKSGTLSDTNEEVEQIDEAKEKKKQGRPTEEMTYGPNMVHINAKRAADNMSNVKHKFENGEVVNMTKAMGVAFLNRHSGLKSSSEKLNLTRYAHQSPEAFENATKGGKIEHVPTEQEKYANRLKPKPLQSK